MRHIDPADILASLERLPEGWKKWQDEAEKALADVRADGGNSETVNAHSDVWRSLKSQLEQVSDCKCWYCESSQHRADNAVHGRIGLGKKALQAILSENARFVGAAPHQVDAFLAEVKPLSKKHRGAAEYKPGRLL